MWLSRLDLLAYGRFTNVTLPLGPGFHLVYGPNEAGKSTTLRAIRQLLFGFDERTSDNFVHANTNLRIGGIVCDETGGKLSVIRRKTRKDSLRAEDDISVIDADQWQTLLQGLDEATFSQRYGIDYEQLIKGGHEIATGNGDLGEILFATGSGISDLAAVQQQLDDEAGEIFKSKGKTQRLNQALSEWQEQREQIVAKQLSVGAWDELDRLRQETRNRRDEAALRLERLSKEIGRYQRWKQAMPLVNQITQLEQQMMSLKSVRPLPADFESRRQQALRLFNQSEAQSKTATDSLQLVGRELAKLVIPNALLARSEELNLLFSDAGSIRKARQDRKQLVADCDRLQQKMEKLMKDAEIQPVALIAAFDRSLCAEVNQLGRQHAGLTQAIQLAELHQNRLQARISEIRRQLTELPVTCPLPELADVIRQIRSEGDLEARQQAVQLEVHRLQREMHQQISELSPWLGTLTELKAMSVPGSQQIKRWEVQFESNRSERNLLQERREELQAESSSLELKIRQLTQEFQIPTEAELVDAREQRNASWSAIREAAQTNRVPPASTINEFEEKLVETDRISDRLRHEADRVAQLADQIAALQSSSDRQLQIGSRIAELDNSRAQLEAGWQAEWPGFKTNPPAPRDMQNWLARRDLVLRQEMELSRRLAEAAAIRSRIDELIGLLRQYLNPENLPSQNGSVAAPQSRRTKEAARPSIHSAQNSSRLQLSFGWDHDKSQSDLQSDQLPDDPQHAPPQTLSELIRTAENLAELNAAVERERQQAEEMLAGLLEEHGAAHEEQEKIRAQQSQWQITWREAMQRLKLDPDITPEVGMRHVEIQFQLFDDQIQIEQLQNRIAQIDLDDQRFCDRVTAICREVASDLTDLEPQLAVSELQTRWTNGQRDQIRRDQLNLQEVRLRQQLDLVVESRHQAQALLKELCESAGLDNCPGNEDRFYWDSTFSSLAEAAEQSKRRRDCEDRLDQNRQLLAGLASPDPVETFLQQIQQETLGSIETKLQRLELDAVQIASEREALTEQLANYEAQLRQMTGSAEAAEAEEQLSLLKAQIRADAEHYARLKLASSVLHTAIERYREQIRGPVLSIASELFREMTLGSFDGLRVEEDDNGKPLLVGLRAGGRDAVPVTGMSEGTCDQLYLALRVASLQMESKPQNGLPLIVDDVLIQFDDARAAAALRVLARLGQNRQVIYFTHHEHLLEIARGHLEDRCQIHRLES